MFTETAETAVELLPTNKPDLKKMESQGSNKMMAAIQLAKENEAAIMAANETDEQEKPESMGVKILKQVWAFITCNRALFLFSEENFVRILARKIIEWPPFEWAILATILTTTVVLAMEEHLPNNDKAALSMKLVNEKFSILFILNNFIYFLFLLIFKGRKRTIFFIYFFL
jgi:hypothetical protein